MFIAGSHHRLLSLSFSNCVNAKELAVCLKRVEQLVGFVKDDFCLLIDLSGLQEMDPGCAADLGRIMDLCDERGVSRIVFVVPDPSKDIGLRLLSLFHFNAGVRIELYGNLPAAIGCLPGSSRGSLTA